MTRKGKISINIDGDHFRFEAETQDGQTVEMDLSLEMLHGLSLAIANILSTHHTQMTSGAARPPMIDIVSPDVSFAATKTGVELTVSGHGLAPIRLTFPLSKSLELVRGLVENAEAVADKMGLQS